MAIQKENSYGTNFVSTFLSYSSTEKDIVERVSKQLGRLGVLAWFDKNELLEMGSLEKTIKTAVQQQSTLTIFLSKASTKSSWCQDELRWAIEASEESKPLLPVYLGDELKLVRGHEVLRERFLSKDGDRVDRLGSKCSENPTADEIHDIAKKIAVTNYNQTIPKPWTEVLIYVDQRGDGPRRGLPALPKNFLESDVAKLTFRPSSDNRQRGEVLTGKDWEEVSQSMVDSFSLALGTVRGNTRKVYVLGTAQTGLMWAVGRHFNRTTSAELYGYDRDNLSITNKGQVRDAPLPGGNPNAAEYVNSQSVPIDTVHKKVALGVGSKGYASTVQKAVTDIPLFWLESGKITDTEPAMELVKNLVASVKRFRQEYETDELVLFWTTANHLALLAAANLTPHVIPVIRYMEWHHAANEYVYLPMPGDS